MVRPGGILTVATPERSSQTPSQTIVTWLRTLIPTATTMALVISEVADRKFTCLNICLERGLRGITAMGFPFSFTLTDMVRNIENGLALIEKWLRNKNTIEFLGIWEEMYNPDFNSPEFEGIKNAAGLNRFILSVKQWVEKTNSRGIIAKAGRYGGTYAHKDIAFEFATWVSPQFKLYLIQEFERMKDEEQKQLGWTAKRELSKINYRIHTDAIKQNLIPEEVTAAQASIIYAEEADVLNVAMFGQTAKQWREAHPELKGNIRDYASINELICLANMENINAVLIDEGVPQGDRLVRLNQIAINQMRVLENDDNRNLLK